MLMLHVIWCMFHVLLCHLLDNNSRLHFVLIYMNLWAYGFAWLCFDGLLPLWVCYTFVLLAALSSDGPCPIEACAAVAKCCAPRRWKFRIDPQRFCDLPESCFVHVTLLPLT